MTTAVRQLEAELLDTAGARLGEGPAWDAAREELVWVDIVSGLVARSAESGTRVLRTDGTSGMLLAVEDNRPELRFNDAKCDPAGRALAGTMRYDQRPGDATLYRLDAGPAAVVVLSGQGLCNGLGWSPDGRTFYYNDTLTSTVAAYPYDPATGALGTRRELTHISPRLGAPDGLCVDSEGCVWVALWHGGAVHRYRPDGVLDTVVQLPVPDVTSVTFGGRRGDRLYITTAGGDGVGAPAARPAAGRRAGAAGGLYACAPGVTGPPATPWRPVAGAHA